MSAHRDLKICNTWRFPVNGNPFAGAFQLTARFEKMLGFHRVIELPGRDSLMPWLSLPVALFAPCALSWLVPGKVCWCFTENFAMACPYITIWLPGLPPRDFLFPI
jgi:hypothetical protein